ncbi:MAG TPA: hypothetical protein VF079_10155 [Sphingomicrobium sp.]
MKKLFLLAATAAALVGCQEAANQPEANASNASAMAPAATPATMVTANGSTPGTYEVTMKDGTKSQSTLMADGTYTDKDAKGKETKGTWNVTNGKTCFDPDGAEGAMCFTESAVAADGSFTATPDKGDPVTVKKVG